jgi:hypothetical protein
MSNTANEPAFPGREDKKVDGSLMIMYNPGVSTRTYLAGQAMMGIMASPEAPVSDYEGMAIRALKAADAIIAELEKTEK